jgi:hypothetical protein
LATHSPLHCPRDEHPYKAPKKWALVLSCVDARLLDDLVSYLDEDNLTNRYYHVTLPGTALGLTDRVSEDTSDKKLLRQFRRWRTTFIDQVQAAIILTNGQISDIYIVQHEDCGAFRVYVNKDSDCLCGDEELHLHRDYAHALLKDFQQNFHEIWNPVDKVTGKGIQPGAPFVHTFFMDLRGHMRHLETWPESQSEDH